jgi:flagellar biosynthesis protein FliQ
MTPDLVAELMRQLLREAMIVAAPLLIAAVLLSFLLSLVQTLTSLQEQSLTAVPRLAAIAVILLVGMPWFLERLANYTRLLLGDLRRYVG